MVPAKLVADLKRISSHGRFSRRVDTDVDNWRTEPRVYERRIPSGPLEVVEANLGVHDLAPDGAAGVVHQDINVPVLVEHQGHQRVDLVEVGEAAIRPTRDTPSRADELVGLES